MRQQRGLSTRLAKRTRLTVAAILAVLLAAAAHAQISLSTAVDLAENSSPAVRASLAEVRRATAALAETKDIYIPNLVLGGSPGYAYGFPLGYPSLVNANSGSLVFSFSEPDYIRAAQAALRAARLSLKDTQQQVALDVSLDYIELNHDLSEIAVLDEEKGYADELVNIEQQRVLAGVDSQLNELQAELTSAQVAEKRIHFQNDADEMRDKLGHLTGLPATGLTTDTASVPPAPNINAEANDRMASNTPDTSAAYANAQSRFYTAFGDKRQNLRPLIQFGASYSLFAKFNNYTQYFRSFQSNNAEIGFIVSLPVFDAVRRAHAKGSLADALHAQAQADQSRDILAEQTDAMRRSLLEMSAQQRVASLRSQLAQAQLQTVETQLINGTGSANAQPVTPKQAQQAHIEERERYEDSLDAGFSLMKLELNLLRSTGQILDWVASASTGATVH